MQAIPLSQGFHRLQAGSYMPTPVEDRRYSASRRPSRKRNALRPAASHICLGEYAVRCFNGAVHLLRIYDCLCDATRLRLLNLLAEQPLCVCHLEAALKLPQARISRHLAYLRRNGLVTVAQQGPWRVYALASPVPAALSANLACLQDARASEPQFAQDLARLAHLSTKLDCGCATSEVPRRRILRLTRR